MPGTATKTNPALWEKVKSEVTQSAKGGQPGQWSARKAQLATQAYKKAGGGYAGHKSSDNKLEKWQREEWGTRSGQTSASTGERYLPKKARDSLSRDEYDRSTRKKRADSAKGEQFSAQPKDVARKTAKARNGAPESPETRDALMEEARRRGIAGRSRMKKAELAQALGR
jgi:hypothetical protein